MNILFYESLELNELQMLLAFDPLGTVQSQFWYCQTSTDWWDCIVIQAWDNQQWLHNFCMLKAAVMEVCGLLSPTLKHKNTIRPALTMEK